MSLYLFCGTSSPRCCPSHGCWSVFSTRLIPSPRCSPGRFCLSRYLVAVLLAFKWLPRVIEERSLREGDGTDRGSGMGRADPTGRILLAISLLIGVLAGARALENVRDASDRHNAGDRRGLRCAISAWRTGSRIMSDPGSFWPCGISTIPSSCCAVRLNSARASSVIRFCLWIWPVAPGCRFLRTFGVVFGGVVLALGFYQAIKTQASDTARWRAFAVFMLLLFIVHVLWTDKRQPAFCPCCPFSGFS